MKNLKGSYLEHISRVIVGVFCHCFEKLVSDLTVTDFCTIVPPLFFLQTVSEPRKSLYKLRTTWTALLSKQKLAAIDKFAHELDPNWPVIAIDANTIFFNPEFKGVSY